MYSGKHLAIVLSLHLLAWPLNASLVQSTPLAPSVRALKAASRMTTIRSRGIDGCLNHDLDLHYLDDSTYQTSLQFTAHVQVSPKLPTLLLEEIEHHIDGVTCFDFSIHLHFTDVPAIYAMYQELSNPEEFFVVTSHEGCNKEGERVAYRVFDLGIDEGDRKLILSTTPSLWEDAVHSVAVHFGPSSENFELRQNPNLRARQAATSSAAISSALASFTQSVSSTTSIDFPSPTSVSGMPTETSITINKSWVDQQIWPMVWDTSLGNVSLSGPKIPSGFTLSCKECSITGGIDLVSGSFNATATKSASSEFEKLKFFLEYGYVELRSNQFAAHIELETTIQPSESLITYHVNLPSINFLGFEIPGVATVGPLLVPQLRMGLKLATELEFTYGFDVKVPDNSVIKIDLLNVTNSFVSGFSDSTITALPFQAKVAGLDLVLSTSFSPELLLGLSLFAIDTNIGAGARFDLPSITAAVSQLDGVDAHCQRLEPSSSDADSLSNILGNLTHIVPSVDFGLDLIAFVDINNFGVDINDVYQALHTELPLPTVCLRFDGEAMTYGPATATATPTASGAAATASSGAVASFSPTGVFAKDVDHGGFVGIVLFAAALLFWLV